MPDNVPTIQQIKNYLASVNGVANPNALYVIKTGDNDVIFVTNQGPSVDRREPQLSERAGSRPGSRSRGSASGRRTHHRGAEFF